VKPINPGEIAVLIATRARPDMLVEVFESLKKNTTRKDKTVLWIYVDQDDPITRDAIDQKKFPDPGIPVHWHIGYQTASLGQAHDILWQEGGYSSEIYMISVDDARFDTNGWDEIVRKKFAEYPDGVLLAFPHDPMSGNIATYPIYGHAWLNTIGRIFTGYFPYWFEDRWVGQVGDLAGRCEKLPILLYPIRGKGRTRRMRNLPFWTRFFQLMLDERKEAARKLIAATKPTDEAHRTAALSALEKTAADFAREQNTFSDIYCLFQEERHTDLPPQDRQVFDAKYFKQESLAVAKLIDRARASLAGKNYAEAMVFLDATQLSDMRVKQAQLLKAQCLRGLGREAEARQIEAEALAAWPEFSGTRRFFRLLGMVANEAKTLLVGLTSRGKKK
jgi:hypothetical protein